MKELDYIIVGLGIAGISLCEQFIENNKSFVVFDSGLNSATEVSGGVFNPVVLKRFTVAWNSKEFLEVAIPFYETLSKKLQIPVIEKIPVLRIFKNVEEQNDWSVASDKLELTEYLSAQFLQNNNPCVRAPFGFGKVNGTGIVNAVSLLKAYRENLQKNGQLVNENFDYNSVLEKNGVVHYKNFSAKKIIFAEGIAAVKNPFAPPKFLIGNKGEYLIIKAPQLDIKEILKGSVFIIPLGNGFYKVGATYKPEKYTYQTTKIARQHIELKLNKIINCPFEIIDHIAGVRPTTHDRRPLLGNFPGRENFVFFNGLGTHGIMMAPLLSELLFEFLEKEKPLPREIDINRYFK